MKTEYEFSTHDLQVLYGHYMKVIEDHKHAISEAWCKCEKFAEEYHERTGGYITEGTPND